MKIRGYKFGHPVFGVYDYYDFGPEFSVSFRKEDNELIVTQDAFSLGSNRKLSDLLTNGDAVLIAEIFCTYTMYRKCHRLQEDFSIRIPIENLKYQVELLFFIVSNKEFRYYNESIKKNLRDESYDIEEGDILAFLGEYKYVLDIKGTSVESFIRIREKVENKPGVEYIYVERSIIINVDRKKFEAIRKFSNNLSYQKILISGLLQPALIHACYLMREEGFVEKEWARTLMFRWNKFNDSSSEEPPPIIKIPEFVEFILKDPLNQLIDALDFIDEGSRNVEFS